MYIVVETGAPSADVTMAGRKTAQSSIYDFALPTLLYKI